jgi:hypothetical protein
MDEHITAPQETKEEKIQRLLARMEEEDRTSRGKSLDEQRVIWQKKPGLRYVIGPFMAGQLFDLWQWLLGLVDNFLWGWAQKSVPSPPKESKPEASNPRASLRQALEKKKTDNR